MRPGEGAGGSLPGTAGGGEGGAVFARFPSCHNTTWWWEDGDFHGMTVTSFHNRKKVILIAECCQGFDSTGLEALPLEDFHRDSENLGHYVLPQLYSRSDLRVELECAPVFICSCFCSHLPPSGSHCHGV